MSQEEHLAKLERELEQLKKQLPKHGLKPSTVARLDELEEEIDALKNQIAASGQTTN